MVEHLVFNFNNLIRIIINFYLNKIFLFKIMQYKMEVQFLFNFHF